VLIPILWNGPEGPCFILTRRSRNVKHHKGEISFPGGAWEEKDTSLQETALRESEEEIGLKKSQVRVLGSLDDTCVSVSSFVITPFVGYIEESSIYQADKVETTEIFEIPLSFFYDPNSYRTCPIPYKGITLKKHAYPWKNDVVVWGATARIIRNFCQLLPQALDNL
jgi:8-oxo-dGTP pyrophosphatase MutT (NUDIX family)